MAKNFKKLDETNLEFVLQTLSETTLSHVVKFTFISDDTMNDVININKLSPIPKYISNGIEIALIINENYFDLLPDEYKKIAILEAVHPIRINEVGNISILQPDVVTFSDFIEKTTFPEYLKFIESVKSVKDVTKENVEKTNVEIQTKLF